MKITLNSDSYMIIEKDGNAIRMGIKTKQGKESYLISVTLKKEHLDTIITQLISLRTRLNNVEED